MRKLRDSRDRCQRQGKAVDSDQVIILNENTLFGKQKYTPTHYDKLHHNSIERRNKPLNKCYGSSPLLQVQSVKMSKWAGRGIGDKIIELVKLDEKRDDMLQLENDNLSNMPRVKRICRQPIFQQNLYAQDDHQQCLGLCVRPPDGNFFPGCSKIEEGISGLQIVKCSQAAFSKFEMDYSMSVQQDIDLSYHDYRQNYQLLRNTKTSSCEPQLRNQPESRVMGRNKRSITINEK